MYDAPLSAKVLCSGRDAVFNSDKADAVFLREALYRTARRGEDGHARGVGKGFRVNFDRRHGNIHTGELSTIRKSQTADGFNGIGEKFETKK